MNKLCVCYSISTLYIQYFNGVELRLKDIFFGAGS